VPNFIEKLTQASRKNQSLLCIGLDPDPGLMPDNMKVIDFNKAIIDATADLVCTYKLNLAFYELNLAFYEVLGDEGTDTLKKTISHIPDNIPVIGDAKRGDIGNTAKAYARAVFDYFNFDATTVNPYLGFDSVEPFIQYHDRGVFILCRTSNAGAVDFQSLPIDSEWLRYDSELEDLLVKRGGLSTPIPFYEIVAERANLWNKNGNIGLVVGATYPEELWLLRQSHPDMPLLIPGVGAQGGELSKAVRYGVDKEGQKAIINSSRQILYASRGNDFAQAARRTATELRDQMNSFIPQRSA